MPLRAPPLAMIGVVVAVLSCGKVPKPRVDLESGRDGAAEPADGAQARDAAAEVAGPGDRLDAAPPGERLDASGAPDAREPRPDAPEDAAVLQTEGGSEAGLAPADAGVGGPDAPAGGPDVAPAPSPPQPSSGFHCGPDWVPYRAYSGGSFFGIRCVKYVASPGGVFAYAWYGEGTRGARYRHVGYTRWNGDRYLGSQADVRDNELDHNGFFDGKTSVHCNGSACGGYLDTLRVDAWDREEWRKAGDAGAVIPDYTSPFSAPPADCGDQFRTADPLGNFKAFEWASSSTFALNGSRCAVKISNGAEEWDVWLGAGKRWFRDGVGAETAPTPWKSPNPYLNVGIRVGPNQYVQLDVCTGGACAKAEGLTLNGQTYGQELVGGGLHERWFQTRARHAVRLKVLKLRSAPGVLETPLTAADVEDQVRKANQALGPHLEILYRSEYPDGADSDLELRTDPMVNLIATKDTEPMAADQERRARATYYGELFPGRVVALYAWGRDPMTNLPLRCPSDDDGSARAGANNFLLGTAIRRGPGCGLRDPFALGEPDVTNFARQIGNYFGLSQVFGPHFGTGTRAQQLAEAESAYARDGCTGAVFDGDGLADTAPAPSLGADLADLSVQAVTLTCATTRAARVFPLPRTNIMSRFLSDRLPTDVNVTVPTTKRSYWNRHQITPDQRLRLDTAPVGPFRYPGFPATGAALSTFEGNTRWWRLE